jgi:hypothetical protein
VTQLRLDRADDTARRLVLHLEDVVERAIEAVCPDVGACRRVDQLTGDAHAITGFAHRAFEDIAHAQFAPDLPQVG